MGRLSKYEEGHLARCFCRGSVLVISRRQFIASLGALGAIPVLWPFASRDGRLSTLLRKPSKTIGPGDHSLPLASTRPTLLYVPPSYRPDTPAPFLLVLHGATGAGINQLNRYRKYAEQSGAVVMAPSSEGGTWDAIRGTFDDDCSHIDDALAYAFDRCSIDAKRVAIGGFSDGASYALSLGIINGELFTHLVAFSPGFVIPGERRGKPGVFISHGRQDPILPIDQCGRRIARELKGTGYTVDLEEFDGGHQMQESMIPVAAAFMNWRNA
jgi:predicted esterase